MGTKRSGLTDENGLPLSVVLSGANTHDVKLLEETLDHIVIFRPEPEEDHPQNLCLDAGCTGSGEKVRERVYTPHIRPCSNWPALLLSGVNLFPFIVNFGISSKSAKTGQTGIAEQVPDEIGESYAARGSKGPYHFAGREDSALCL